MKKLFLLLAVAALAMLNVMAENYPTKFLGIPIDGTKQEMIKKIQAKGFKYHNEYGQEYLDGEFNGADVHVYVVTNNNKVYRIMVAEVKTWSEGQIRIRYNNLMQQFKDNTKYMPGDITQGPISEDEDISYEMAVHSKIYSANFNQITHPVDTTILKRDLQTVAEELLSEYTEEEIEADRDFFNNAMLYIAAKMQYEKNSVWFTIHEFEGEYYLTLYYDNLYNQANGEDL